MHVRGREPDGYHRLETIFAFAEDGDLLRVAAADSLSLRIEGPFAAALSGEDDNLVLRAARALAGWFGVRSGAALTLQKNLPVASGIGGGSADAAAALRLLNRFWKLHADTGVLAEIAKSLGADVPACLLSRTARGEGRGDELALLPAPELAGMPALLVNPMVPVSTAAVFRDWDGVDRGPLLGWREGRNDLQGPARAIAPEVDAVLAALSAAPFARMSGSGATCFALFDDVESRDRLRADISPRNPAWWCLATRLI